MTLTNSPMKHNLLQTDITANFKADSDVESQFIFSNTSKYVESLFQHI